jgi:hypothetical protein
MTVVSFHAAVLEGRPHPVLRTGFETVVAGLLQSALHHVDLQKVPHLLPEEDLLLDFNGVSQLRALLYFTTSLYAGLMEHLVVSCEGLHHGLKEPPIEH